MSNIYSAIGSLFLIGLTVMGLGGALQTRLMDVAGDAQTLAASLNHSAFNLANALGAFRWLGTEPSDGLDCTNLGRFCTEPWWPYYLTYCICCRKSNSKA